jgi:hypothetical protein
MAKSVPHAPRQRSRNLTTPTSISIPKDLHTWWKNEADIQRRSFSGVVIHLLELERRRVIAFRESAPVNLAGLPLSMAEQWLYNTAAATPEAAAPAAKPKLKR